MKHFLAVLLFAVIAGLVSCEVASKGGIRGIPATWKSFMGGSGGAPMVAKFEAAAIDAADVKAKVADVVADAKAKVAEVAEKAVEAAQPDRSDAIAPAPVEAMPEPAPVAEAAPTEAAVPVEAQVAAQPVEPAAEAAVEPAAPTSVEDAAPVSLGGVGQTSYFGIAEKADAGQPWAADATMNAEQVAQAAAAETPAIETPAAADAPAEVPVAAEPAATAEAAVPSPEEAPVSLGGAGQTSYFGLADKPDSDNPWAASAAMNPDYTVDAPAPKSPADAAAEAAPAPEPEMASPPESVASAADDPPSSLGGVGQTSFFGLASMPDADRPWAADAAMNPDYTADLAIAEAPAAEPAAEAAASVEEPAPVSLGGIGQTSYNGISEKADATQPWSAGATMNPDYSSETQAAAPTATPATPEAIENCRDALNAEVQAGGLNFGLTRWDITPDEYSALDRIAKLAKDCGGVKIEVGGHADETGRRASNKTLSELRAKAVVNYLIKAGVDPSKLKAVGYGQDKPIGDNATAEGRRKNRRIEFLVSGN